MQRGRLKPCDQETIKRNYMYLLRNLDAKEIVDFLYEKGMIDDQKEEINSLRNRRKRTEKFLDSVLLRSGEGGYQLFLDSLQENHSYIVKQLEEPYWWIDSTDKDDSIGDERKKHVINGDDTKLISSCLEEGWEYFMMYLGFSGDDIDARKAINQEDTKSQLLAEWAQQNPEKATVEYLLKDLKLMEQGKKMKVDWLKLFKVLKHEIQI